MNKSIGLAVVLTLALVVGCSQQRSDYHDVRDVTFECSPGETLRVTFFPVQGVAVLYRGDEQHELDQKPAASGFWYSDGSISLRGKGDDLTIEQAGAAPLECRAR